MRNRNSLFAIGFQLILIGFVKNNNHHRFNYIEEIFHWYSIRGEPVKVICYNLMIPIRNLEISIIGKNNELNENQKDIIPANLLQKDSNNEIILPKFSKLIKLDQINLSSFMKRLRSTKELQKMHAFGIDKSHWKKYMA